MPASVTDLAFVDLYLERTGDGEIGRCYYRPPGRMEVLDLDDRSTADLGELMTLLATNVQQGSRRITFRTIPFRASRIDGDGSTTFVIRRPLHPLPALAALQLSPPMVATLRDLGRQQGLVLVVGRTGEGKSTTAAMLLCEWLRQHGGFGVAAEDPPELALGGRYGDIGLCIQVDSSLGLRTVLEDSLRWNPSYLLIGEIRSAEEAATALRHATAGRMVLSTIHGGSIQEGLVSLANLASAATGWSRAATLETLAIGLRAVLGQRLDPGRRRAPGQTPTARQSPAELVCPELEFLHLPSQDPRSLALRDAIRKGEIAGPVIGEAIKIQTGQIERRPWRS